MKIKHENNVQWIAIEHIRVVNPRSRGKRKFRQIVANISNLGLKKPITVVRAQTQDSAEPVYDLVCGQGRLEAFLALGQKEVPAIVVEAERGNLMLMGLIENLARRPPTSVEQAKEIAAMKSRGMSNAQIAKKVGLTVEYVRGLLRLLQQGEECLITAVENEVIPLSTAIMICESSDADIQKALMEAYETGELRGNALTRARRVIEHRRLRGKTGRNDHSKNKAVTSASLIRAYRNEVGRQQLFIEKARQFETRLRFVVTAMKNLVDDESFTHLLRTEALLSMPKYLSEHIHLLEPSHGI